jgi:putative flippase GtrA
MLRSTLSHFISRQFGVFLLVGGVAAVANFGAGAAVRLFSTSDFACEASVVVGMIVGSILSFFSNRRYTFAVSDEPAGPQAKRFTIVSIGSIILAYVVSKGMLEVWTRTGSLWVSRATADHLVAITVIGLNTVYGFLAHKFFSLKRTTVAAPARSLG